MQNESDSEYWRNEQVGFLALTQLKGVGFWTLYRIARAGISFKGLLKSSAPTSLERYLRSPLPSDCNWADLQQDLWKQGLELARNLAKQNISLLFNTQPGFPPNLSKIEDDCPQWLFIQGNLQNLYVESIAIVGTRKPSNDGIFLTRLIVTSIAYAGVPTISGLAHGIDQCAHLESIKYGIPTIAVLGTGILQNYPSGSESLRETILTHGGTVISEYLPLQSYSAENFVRRNRIQAALCGTLIPVEWKIKSGTAHTVEFAFNYEKKIANIYLPHTLSGRPEIAFSQANRNAKSYELPHQLIDFLNFVRSDKNSISLANYPMQQAFDI
jgi:DNA protecting protein DprA